MKSTLVQQRTKQRNITPNFLRFKRKNSTNNKSQQKNGLIQTNQNQNTQRSSSKASRCSFEVYEKRDLHLSKLRKNLNLDNDRKRQIQPPANIIKRTNFIAGQSIKVKPLHSNEKNIERESSNNNQIQNFTIHRLSQNKKKTTSSGKNLLRTTNRATSSHKGSQSSLQKEQENAKRLNAELINTMMKNHITPNYINKVKQKKIQTQKKKPKSSILNLNIPIKSEEQLKKYQIFQQLGKGAYGIVKMGIEIRKNQKIAIKIYEKKRLDEPNKIKNLERQINLLAELSHKTIARLIEAIQTPTQIYLILQYGGVNSLYNYLLSKPQHRLQEWQAKRFVLTIAEALEYLHRNDIVHRDIKAQNILINRHKQLKLIDFGFSLRCAKNQTIDTFCGTPTYMAPEIVSKVDHCPVYTDMWSLGILYYVMLQGNYPFRAKNQNDLFEKIKKGHFEYIHEDITDRSRKFIENLLRVNPLERLTIYDVLSKENRAWLNSQAVNLSEQNTESF